MVTSDRTRDALDLPDDLELPLLTGAPWWYWLGGRPAVDLVNTRRERWRRCVETLVTPEDLGRWLVATGLVPEPQAVTDEVLAEARDLREAIDAGIVATVAGRPPDAAAIALLDRWLVIAGGRPQLTLAPDGRPVLGERTVADSPRRALGLVALDAAQMLGRADEAGRVRICASETCSARFYDRSPAGKRRWCSMKTCGNAAKVRAHRARAKRSA